MKQHSKLPPHKIPQADWKNFLFTKDQIINSLSYFDEKINDNWKLGVPTIHYVAARKALLKLS